MIQKIAEGKYKSLKTSIGVLKNSRLFPNKIQQKIQSELMNL